MAPKVVFASVFYRQSGLHYRLTWALTRLSLYSTRMTAVGKQRRLFKIRNLRIADLGAWCSMAGR
jgi:hypothetical protein